MSMDMTRSVDHEQRSHTITFLDSLRHFTGDPGSSAANRPHFVLSLRGLTMEANEAAADFLFNPEAMSELSRLGEATTPIEILLRNKVAEGASSGFEVVAVRHLK